MFSQSLGRRNSENLAPKIKRSRTRNRVSASTRVQEIKSSICLRARDLSLFLSTDSFTEPEVSNS